MLPCCSTYVRARVDVLDSRGAATRGTYDTATVYSRRRVGQIVDVLRAAPWPTTGRFAISKKRHIVAAERRPW